MTRPHVGSQLDIYDALEEPRPVRIDRPDPVELSVLAWLASYQSPNTRRAYERDVRAWLAWCADHDLHPHQARRVHVDAWARQGASMRDPAPSSLARRLSSVSAWYAYCTSEDLADRNPVANVRRPKVDAMESNTRGLTADEAKVLRLIAAERMPRRARIAIDMGLLLGFRRASVIGADVADLSRDRGHRTLTYTTKGGRRRTTPLPPDLAYQIDEYLDGRQTGPLLITSGGRRVDGSTLFREVRRAAELAGLEDPATVTPHSLRHTFITLGLEAGVKLEVMQDAAGHADPRQTRVYDHARRRLEGHPAYVIAAQLG